MKHDILREWKTNIFSGLPLKVRDDDFRTRLRFSTYLKQLRDILKEDAEDFFLAVFLGGYAELFAAGWIDKSREDFDVETYFQYKNLLRPLKGWFVSEGITPAWAESGGKVGWRMALKSGLSVKTQIKKKIQEVVKKGACMDAVSEMISDITFDIVWVLKKAGMLTDVGEKGHADLLCWACYSTFVDVKTHKTAPLYPYFTPKACDFWFGIYINTAKHFCPKRIAEKLALWRLENGGYYRRIGGVMRAISSLDLLRTLKKEGLSQDSEKNGFSQFDEVKEYVTTQRRAVKVRLTRWNFEKNLAVTDAKASVVALDGECVFTGETVWATGSDHLASLFGFMNH